VAMPAVNFGGLTSLTYATLIMTAVNFVVHVL